MVHLYFSRLFGGVRFRYGIAKRAYCTSKKDVRVRFAPSPTGNLHLGGLRTALFNYLYAKKNSGKFILRIEDTDQKRVIPGSIENLEGMLSWAGIPPDEGPSVGGLYGPYVQSQRVQMYKNKAQELLESGHAYRCFCSETRLEIMRKEARKNNQNPRYDNKCRHLSGSEIDELISKKQPFTIRFKMHDGPMTFEDIVFGTETMNVSEYEGDFIIVKSDGFPTYHFACVVDDHNMEISHVLRGAEWLPSTTKHLMLHSAFGWKPPQFAHLPLMVNKDRTKLSKRQEALGIQYLKEKGYEPLALLNFLCGVGAGFGLHGRIDVCGLDELSEMFNLTEVSRGSCCLEMEKLDIYNTKYFVQLLSKPHSTKVMVEKFRALLSEMLGPRYDEQAKHLTDEYIEKILNLYKERVTRLNELVELDMQYLWTMPNVENVQRNLQQMGIGIEDTLEGIEATMQMLVVTPDTDFERPKLKVTVRELSKDRKLPPSTFMRMLRIVSTGLKDGPGVPEIFSMLGKTESLRKLETVSAALEKNHSSVADTVATGVK